MSMQKDYRIKVHHRFKTYPAQYKKLENGTHQIGKEIKPNLKSEIIILEALWRE